METDPAKIPCTEGGQMHVIPRPMQGVSRVACSDCLKVFVLDRTWAQGWRPAETEETFERLYQAEKVVREQRADLAERVWETEDWTRALADLHKAVMGGAFDLSRC
jgi:hypothetical protein